MPKPNKLNNRINGYRPISLIPCSSKILEKIVAKRLLWFLESKNLISSNQVAFKANKGCEDALLHLDFYITKALSSRNHVTILSLDFEKAFDRIGIHQILNKITSWGIGPKIFNYIKSFLTNRKICVKTNNCFSNYYPLHNGIPQGSPLSVVLFLIAFDEVSNIISKHPQLDHCIYADDVYILCKHNSLIEQQNLFSNALTDILSWCNTSGAKLSVDKCKTLHVCRKTSCKQINFKFNNINIVNVNNLSILGIIFSDRYNFKKHCIELKKSLAARANLVNFLSCKKSKAHLNTLCNITRSLVLSKIDYGLLIYGNSPKATINIIKSPYHQAVRRSLNAFPTSPVRNMLAEAGLPLVEERILETRAKLYTKLSFVQGSIINEDFKTLRQTKCLKRIPSAISIALTTANSMELPSISNVKYFPSFPPWCIKKSSFIMEMTNYNKSNTSNSMYQSLFYDITAELRSNDWNIVFTDGSKVQESTSFASTYENGSLISIGLLDNIASIFTAEATAILQTARIIAKLPGKFVICSDSQSVLHAIQNPNNTTNIISKIRDQLINYPNKLKLMWIPGHVGILGNEHADKAANDAHFSPVKLVKLLSKRDVLREVQNKIKEQKLTDWSNYSNSYKFINITKSKPIYPNTTSKQMNTVFVRLRLGHTTLTHQHLLKKESPPTCPHCQSRIDINHILGKDMCKSLTSNTSVNNTSSSTTEILNNFDPENIKQVYNFIKLNNIHI